MGIFILKITVRKFKELIKINPFFESIPSQEMWHYFLTWSKDIYAFKALKN